MKIEPKEHSSEVSISLTKYKTSTVTNMLTHLTTPYNIQITFMALTSKRLLKESRENIFPFQNERDSGKINKFTFHAKLHIANVSISRTCGARADGIVGSRNVRGVVNLLTKSLALMPNGYGIYTMFPFLFFRDVKTAK
jgi:hypothetical protein